MSRGRGQRIIAGQWRGRRLTEVEGAGIRPTADRVREAWMSAMGGRFDGLVVLDLFCGTGALGLECLSRGARHVTFVDAAPGSLATLRANLELLEVDPASMSIVQADAVEWVDTLPPDLRADVAMADPPYEGGWHVALARRFETRAFAASLWVEHRATEPLDSPLVTRARTYGQTTLTTLSPPDSP